MMSLLLDLADISEQAVYGPLRSRPPHKPFAQSDMFILAVVIATAGH
jgi:hypothetical protein